MSSEADANRRLQPALNALYSKNYRQAIKLATAAEQKKKGWVAAKAVKALALRRARRYREAADVIQGIDEDLKKNAVRLTETDALKLQLYFRESGQNNDAARVCSLVWDADPNNVSIGEQVFFGFMNAADFTSAKRVATRLQKIAPGNVFYKLWSAVATHLQVKYELADKRLAALGARVARDCVQFEDIKNNNEAARLVLLLLNEVGEIDAVQELLRDDGALANSFSVVEDKTSLVATMLRDSGKALLKPTCE
mmetsp:Transcript_7241/g.22068  ORF Transcript_7241/g.22068 Transcript_7241/m.22068 type:complete len:253 (+) Transcript_7241:175-933(+)